MKKLCFIFLFILSIFNSRAFTIPINIETTLNSVLNSPAINLTNSNITQIEYFIDIDPGFGNGLLINITPDTNISSDINIPMTTVSDGFHTLYIRVKDNQNIWSLTHTIPFYKYSIPNNTSNKTISRLEYFIDSDPGFGYGTSVSTTNDTMISRDFVIPMTTIGNGFHTLYLRAMDNQNNWSLTHTMPFCKMSHSNGINQNITKMEYFVDIDPGFGNGTEVLTNNEINISSDFVIPMTNTGNGFHTLYIRAMDNLNLWSLTHTIPFYKMTGVNGSNKSITKLEYFIDNDPGFDNGIVVSVSPDSNISRDFIANLNGLTNSFHTLYVRAKDNENRWSLTQIDTFRICIPPQQTAKPSGTSLMCINPPNSTYTTLKVNDTVTYSWRINPASAGVISGTDTIATVDWNDTFTGQVYIIALTQNSCTTTPSDSLLVSINHIPTLSFTATPSLNVCSGTSVTLTGSGANSYSWSGGISDGVAFIPSETTVYTLTGTNGENCSATIEARVTVGGSFTLATSATNVNCDQNNGTATVTVSDGNIGSGSGQLSYTATTTMNSFYGANDLSKINDGIFTDGVIFQTINPYELTMTFASSVRLDSVKIKGGQFNGNYNIPGTMLLYRGTSASGTLLSSIVPTYNYQNYSFANNHTSQLYTWVITPLVQTGHSSIIEITCFGSTETYTYQWSANAGNQTTATATSLGIGTYSVVVTDANGCSKTAAKTVNGDSISVGGNISGSTAVCSGINSTTLTLSGNTGNIVKWQSTTDNWLTVNDIANTSTTYMAINLSTTTQYRVVVQSGICNPINSATATITVNSLPANADIISGTFTVCQNQNGIIYTVPAINNATSYTWTLPGGASGSSSANSITVSFSGSAISGDITVKGHNSCGDGSESSKVIIVNQTPATPIITVQNNCGNSVLSTTATDSLLWSNGATNSSITVSNSATYSVLQTINGCTSFAGSGISAPLPINTQIISISASPGTTVTSGTTITFTASASGIVSPSDIKWYVNNILQATTGLSFSIIPVNGDSIQAKIEPVACNTGANSNTFTITIDNSLPSAAETISGITSVCKGQNGVVYSVTPIINATTYIWTLPSGATGISSTNSIMVNFGLTAISDSIKVKGHNSIGDGPYSALKITVNTVPLAAGLISGLSPVCQGQNNVSYTIPSISNATSYSWSLPSGANEITSSNSISVNYGNSAISGYISVRGYNSCGDGEPSLKAITINPLPASAGTIIGSTTICKGEGNLVYSVPLLSNATNYIWTLPSGATGSSNTNSITVNFGESAVSGNISVRGNNSCGDGNSSFLYINVNQPSVAATDINGNLSLCVGENSTLSIVGGTLGTLADWKWYAGSCDSNLIGTGTSIIVNPTATTTYFVRAENSCNFTNCVSQTVNVSNNHLPVLSYTGNNGFVSNLVNPTDGTPANLYRFEVRYTDSDGNFPDATYPRLQLDFEGNASYTNSNDRLFFLQEINPNDLNVTDGKDYYYIASALPESQNWNTLITVKDDGGCSSSIGPVNEPNIMRLADLSIFANDITFSNSNPNPGDYITVNATIHNYSGRNATNFVVHLVNQFSPSTVYPDITVQQISAYGSTTVSWTIQTPPNPAWCPMQVFIDYTDALAEPNELDNQAIRPFKNGNYSLPGRIVITANANPYTSLSGTAVSICGSAYYTGTAVQLTDTSCAGATVNYTIVETGQTGSTNTNSLGNYCFSFNAPITGGIYHANVHITDYTLDGDTATSFEIIEPAVVSICVGPDLVSSISLSAGISNCSGSYCTVIRAGQSLTGTITISNVGNAASTATTLKIDLPDGTPVPGLYTIPALSPGQSYLINLPSMTFNTLGGTYISSYADFANQANECNEFNNSNTACILVLPVLPDIIASGSMSPEYYQCQFNSLSFRLDNVNGTATGSFNTRLKVYKGGVLNATLNQTVATINPLCWTYVTFNYSPPDTGSYSFEFQSDNGNTITETNETNNNVTLNTLFSICKPDVYVSGCGYMKVEPVNPTYPGTIKVLATVINGGLAVANGPFIINFDVAGTIYPYTFSGNLPVNQSQQIFITVPAPSFGNNSLIVTADAANVLSESNEYNNASSANLCWDFSLSSLCGGNMFWNYIQMRNQPVTFTVGAYNFGIYEASHLKVKFEVSGPGLSGWVDLGYVSTYAGTTCACPFSVTLPTPFAFQQTGTYQVRMTADYGNEYIECNEANNVLIVTVQVSDLPDYRVLSQHIAPSLLNPEPNVPISIDLTYENIGTTSNDSLEFFAQVNNTPFDSLRVNGLMSGTFSTIHLSNSWSSALRGIHVIRAVIDHDNDISETNELNNEATRAFVVGKSPNLQFYAFDVSDTLPAPGTPVYINATIRNNGYAHCDATYQLFYIDNNNIEIPIGQQAISVDSLSNIYLTIPWIVTDSRTTIIGRILNSNPSEYDVSDNEASKNIGGLLQLSVLSTPASCYSYSNGVAKVIISGGQPPYYTMWSNGQTSDSIIVAAGTYSVMVIDAIGKIENGTVQVTEPAEIPASVSIITSSNVVCPNISIPFYATPTNGGNTPIYQWIKNGINVGNNSSAYSYIPANGDTISCVMTSNLSCASGNPATSNLIIMSVNDLAGQAGNISGSSSVCQGQSGVDYQLPLIAGADTYLWTLPNGASGISTTNNITVNYSPTATSGNITVKGGNTCGYGEPAQMIITVNVLPDTAGIINGPANITKNQSGLEYSTAMINNISTYLWTLPSGMTTTNNLSQSITTSTNQHAYSGLITVRGQNNCGLGAPSSLLVKIPKVLNVKLYLQGLFNPLSGIMNKTQDQNGDHFSENTVDLITIETARPTVPYLNVETHYLNLNVDGTVSDIAIPGQDTGSYYIVVKHRNHLETWSKYPVSFDTDTISYDFTVNGNKAYGNNQKMVSTGIYALLVGDVNQDGVVDLSDLVNMNADLTLGSVAYIVYDLNGDGVVDLSDLVIIDENLTNGVVVMTP